VERWGFFIYRGTLEVKNNGEFSAFCVLLAVECDEIQTCREDKELKGDETTEVGYSFLNVPDAVAYVM